MINRGARVLYLANWIAAAFLGFVLMVQWDEWAPLAAKASLTVTDWDGSANVNELRRETAAFAREHRITFAQEVVDFEQRHGVRHLYLVDGDPAVAGSDWLDGGYRDFTRSTTTQVHSFAELENRTPIGKYDVFGDADKASEMRAFLASRGISAYVDGVRTRHSIPNQFRIALFMLVFFSVAVIGAGVLAGAKAYGIGRLHGLSYGRLLFSDFRAAALAWVGSGTVVTAGAAVVLSFYNGMAAFGTFIGQVLVFNLLLALVALATNAVALLLVMQLNVHSALKGELPGRAAVGLAYVLRVAAVIVTVGTMATAFEAGLDVADRERSFNAYERMGDTSALSLGNAYTLEDQDLLAKAVGSWLREQDRRKNIILAGQMRLASHDPLLNRRTVLFVNEAFLERQPVGLADGDNYVGGAEEVIDLLIPDGLWDRKEAIVADLNLDVSLREDIRGITSKPVRLADGQEFFTYSAPSATQAHAGSWSFDQAYVTNPVIIVLPSARGLLTDDAYASFASAAGLFFPDPTTVKDAVAGDQELQRYIRAVVPVADQAAMEIQTLVREFRMALFTAGIGVLVLTITGIGVVLTYTKRNSQLIFARHVNGWRFSAVHRSLLAIEAVVLVIMVSLLPYQVWSRNRELETYSRVGAPLPAGPGSMTAGQWATVALVAFVTVGGVLAVLAHSHRRVIRHGASEA